LPIFHRIKNKLNEESGIGLVEMLVASTMMLAIITATVSVLISGTRAQTRDESYAEEITSTQAALSRMVHDLRQATAFEQISPYLIEFQMAVGSTTYNVEYNCNATDSRGSPYTRCARTQAVAPANPPAAGSSAYEFDIQHVWNSPTNGYTTFCNGSGTATSGSVFFVTNPSIANTDGSTAACDQTYQNLLASLNAPTYVQIQVEVPASGGQTRLAMNHLTVLESGTYLPNLDAGA
jgi:Tfp pilus assembly protein PilW